MVCLVIVMDTRSGLGEEFQGASRLAILTIGDSLIGQGFSGFVTDFHFSEQGATFASHGFCFFA